jgi:hypothetical protein
MTLPAVSMLQNHVERLRDLIGIYSSCKPRTHSVAVVSSSQ